MNRHFHYIGVGLDRLFGLDRQVLVELVREGRITQLEMEDEIRRRAEAQHKISERPAWYLPRIR